MLYISSYVNILNYPSSTWSLIEKKTNETHHSRWCKPFQQPLQPFPAIGTCNIHGASAGLKVASTYRLPGCHRWMSVRRPWLFPANVVVWLSVSSLIFWEILDLRVEQTRIRKVGLSSQKPPTEHGIVGEGNLQKWRCDGSKQIKSQNVMIVKNRRKQDLCGMIQGM